MNSQDIERWSECNSSVIQQVFSSIVTNPKPSIQNAAIGFTEEVIQRAATFLGTPITVDSKSFLQVRGVQEFLDIASVVTEEDKKKLKYKLMIASFKPIWVRLLCYVFGLNFPVVMSAAKNLDQSYFDIGDGIALAGAFLILQNRRAGEPDKANGQTLC